MDEQKLDFELTPTPLNQASNQTSQKIIPNSSDDSELGLPNATAFPLADIPKVADSKIVSPIQTINDPLDNKVARVQIPLPKDENEDIDLQDVVVKAKQIIERTKTDPYAQNKELHEFKARFMKEQFNKDISLREN